MALIEFKNKPDTTTPINASNLNFNFKEVMNLIYPVNSIIIKADNEDYSDWLGFEWERTLVGRVPVGIDSSDSDFNPIGTIGGEKEHTLTIDEMPNHQHDFRANNSNTSGTTSYPHFTNVFASQNTSSQLGFNPILSVGGGQAHNNLQPYEVVAFWKRIA